MRHPALALVLVAAALAAPRPAAAAPRCPLVGPGSARAGATGNALAIRSADLASNGREITAVVRVADLGDPATAAMHRSFSVYFSRGEGRGFTMRADVNPLDGSWFHLGATSSPFDPERYPSMSTGPTLGWARGVVDTANDEVRITARLSGLRADAAAALRPGGTVRHLGAATAVWVRVATPESSPVRGFMTGPYSDVSFGAPGTAYRLGSRGCVAVGR